MLIEIKNYYSVSSFGFADLSEDLLSDADAAFLKAFHDKYPGPLTPEQLAIDAKEFLGELGDPHNFQGVSLDFLKKFIQDSGVQNIDPDLLANLVKARDAFTSATDTYTKNMFWGLLADQFGGSNWTNKTQGDLITWAQSYFSQDEDAFWRYSLMSDSNVQTLLQIVNNTNSSYTPTSNDKCLRSTLAELYNPDFTAQERAVLQQLVLEWNKIGSSGTNYQELDAWVKKELPEARKFGAEFLQDFLKDILPS